MVPPDTVPVYVMTVGADRSERDGIAVTVPFRGSVPDVDRSIVPFRLPGVSIQVSSKVPVKAPVVRPGPLAGEGAGRRRRG